MIFEDRKGGKDHGLEGWQVEGNAEVWPSYQQAPQGLNAILDLCQTCAWHRSQNAKRAQVYMPAGALNIAHKSTCRTLVECIMMEDTCFPKLQKEGTKAIAALSLCAPSSCNASRMISQCGQSNSAAEACAAGDLLLLAMCC